MFETYGSSTTMSQLVLDPITHRRRGRIQQVLDAAAARSQTDNDAGTAGIGGQCAWVGFRERHDRGSSLVGSSSLGWWVARCFEEGAVATTR